MRFYDPRHFIAQELVPPRLYAEFRGNKEKILTLFDPRILFCIDKIREYYNRPVIINNWHSGGDFSQRGFRTDTKIGAKHSQHRFGRAIDFSIQGILPEEFRQEVRQNRPQYQFMLTYATRIEEGTKGWIHIDCAAVPGVEIVFFKP